MREEWLADGKEVNFFEEMCRANKLAFDVYIEQDKEEHLDRLA